METITSDIQKGIVQLSLFILYAKFFWLKLVYFYDKHIHQMKKKGNCSVFLKPLWKSHLCGFNQKINSSFKLAKIFRNLLWL